MSNNSKIRLDDKGNQYIDIGNECVMCFFLRETGNPPSMKHIIRGEEPWPDTCDLHLQVLDDMRYIFGKQKVKTVR